MTATRPLPCSCTRAATLIEGVAAAHRLDAAALSRADAGRPQGPLDAAGHRAVADELDTIARDLVRQ
jgi:hypothetical protein